MRYKGYVVTYAGGLLKVNKENYYLNGITREDPDSTDVYDMNRDFARRNIYAVSSGIKCDEDGDELSSIAVELMKNYATSNFAEDNQTYFTMLNSAINGQTLKKNDGHFEVDTSVLYIESDVASVYNIGDMPVFYFSKGKMEKLSGTHPKTIEIEKNIYENKWKIHTQVIEKTNTPYLGFPGNEYETVPYASQKIKLKEKAFFLMCSKSVCDVLGEETIEKIFADKHINRRKKAGQIVDMAIEKNPDGNYTVQVISVNKGIPLAHTDAKSLATWLVLVLFCIPLNFAGPYIVNGINGIVESGKAFIDKYIVQDDEPDRDLVWIPKDDKEEEKPNEKPEENEENDGKSDADATSKPVETAPQKDNTPKSYNPVMQNPVTRPKNPVVQNPVEQKPVEQEQQEQKAEPPAENNPVVELPGTTVPPEKNEEVELPIDFN